MVVPTNYKKALAQFSKINGNKPVILFAVLKMDELVDTWSILVSIDWLNDDNRQEVFSSFIQALQDNLEKHELDEVARISFFSPDEHLVGLFFDKFKEDQYIKEDAKVNGNVIHEGYIIKLNKDAIVSVSNPEQPKLL